MAGKNSEGKNAPTPSRKEAEAKNKRSFLAPATSPEDKRAQREAERARRVELRAAYMRGDDAVLPARDKGPVRKFIRDYVDERRTPGEYIFYLLFISIFLSFISRTQVVQLTVILLMYVAVIALILHGLFLRAKIVKAIKAQFPDASTKGAGMYAFMRSTQIRKLRAPAPTVQPTKGFLSRKK